MRRLILLALFALFGAGLAMAQTAPSFPALTGYVVDNAHILQPADVAALDAKLSTFRTQSQRQIVVATLPNLGGDDIDDYANRLLRAWKLGDKQRNDGVLLLIVPSEHKVKIEVGYGLEGIMTDALSSVIITQTIAPRFRGGDYAGGINAATDALIQQLRLPDDQARAVAAQAAQARQARERRPHADPGALVFLVIFVLFFVLPFLRMLNGGGRRYGSGVWILPGLFGGFGGGGGWGGSGGSDWGGGGNDGGNDFMGGGGSSGGGGASGSW